jgi:hypothetical protein
MTTQDFERMGSDLCRTILIYDNVYIPPQIQHLFPKPIESAGDRPDSIHEMLMKELQEDKSLMDVGDGDSSDGSESEPSEDNMPVEEVAKVVPVVDKQQKIMLQKIMKKRAEEEK